MVRSSATAGRRFAPTKSASTQKLPAFAIRARITVTNTDKVGRLCGRVSFRGFAGIATKTQDPSDGCVFVELQSNSCAAAPLHLRSYVRQSFRRLAPAAFVVFVNASCHWLCCWYLSSRRKLPTSHASRMYAARNLQRVTRPCASVRCGRNNGG